ncbi:MAG: MGDG synthase family glycosyltransferase, partial [Ktedonobacteraceae bacterium]
GSQRTILFLIADTGAGHRSAANALRNAITILAEEAQQQWLADQQAGAVGVPEPPVYRMEIVDVFEEYSRFPLREAVKLYGPAIRYNPSLYGRVFHQTNQVRSVKAVKAVAGPLVRKGLLRLITNVQPDVIVSIHTMLNHLTVEAIKTLGLNIPFLTVVTDLVSVHSSWYAPGVDACIVPTEQARQLYLKHGLDAARVHVLGMPIDPKFTQPMPGKAELQQRFELDPKLTTVLLVGGGDGAGGLREAVNAISQARLPVQVMVIAGRNKRLFVQLQHLRASLQVPLKVFGFVYTMPEMMHAADVLVTKAGPGTICEALACDLPLILSSFVPGQEEGNVTFVTENGVGAMAPDPASMVGVLRQLIAPGSDMLSKQLANAQRISRPRASFDIVKYILSYMPVVGEPGIWQGVS